MPQVPLALRRERAARLRAAGEANAARFHTGQIGRTLSVLAESEAAGHSEQFSPVRLAATPGRILAARVTGADARGLIAEAA
jgi:threonylcarbamoyladenosine tRNA methylthiotransferase MtaB